MCITLRIWVGPNLIPKLACRTRIAKAFIRTSLVICVDNMGPQHTYTPSYARDWTSEVFAGLLAHLQMATNLS